MGLIYVFWLDPEQQREQRKERESLWLADTSSPGSTNSCASLQFSLCAMGSLIFGSLILGWSQRTSCLTGSGTGCVKWQVCHFTGCVKWQMATSCTGWASNWWTKVPICSVWHCKRYRSLYVFSVIVLFQCRFGPSNNNMIIQNYHWTT